MSDMSRLDKERASRDARDSVASSPRSPTAEAIAAAMRRYLSAERYHELRDEQGPPEVQQDAADQAG